MRLLTPLSWSGPRHSGHGILWGRFIRRSSSQVPSTNQVLPDFPLDTHLTMTTAQKDQLRSLKNVVNSKLSPSFRSRRQMSLSDRSVITPSATQSECSTLVDFSIDYVVEDEEEYDDTDGHCLTADNAAWGRSRGPHMFSSRKQPTHKTSERHETAEMLDVDDRAWDGSKQNKSLPSRILHALAGQ
ncbi:hypothetical protein BC629DRAFT_1493047 [Irpex lacteus]|nr:hypothetical protein BC629DRAFT_1493047 [Irpex lacteus]